MVSGRFPFRLRSPRVRRFSRIGVAAVAPFDRRSDQRASSATRRTTSDGGASARRRRSPKPYSCSVRISPMNTLVKSVNTNACRNATNSSSSMIPVAMSDAATPTR